MIWAASGADNDQLRSLLLRDLAGIPERSHYDTLQMSPRPLASFASCPPSPHPRCLLPSWAGTIWSNWSDFTVRDLGATGCRSDRGKPPVLFFQTCFQPVCFTLGSRRTQFFGDAASDQSDFHPHFERPSWTWSRSRRNYFKLSILAGRTFFTQIQNQATLVPNCQAALQAELTQHGRRTQTVISIHLHIARKNIVPELLNHILESDCSPVSVLSRLRSDLSTSHHLYEILILKALRSVKMCQDVRNKHGDI